MRHLKLFENFEDYDDEPYVQTDQETFDVAGLRAEHKGVKFKADLRQKILDAMPREWQDKSSSKSPKQEPQKGQQLTQLQPPVRLPKSNQLAE
jgi:hypothetical protein